MSTKFNIINISILVIFLIPFCSLQELKFPFTIIPSIKKTKKQTFLQTYVELPTSPVVFNEQGRQCLEVCFGTKPQCFRLEIQSNSFYMWMGSIKSTLNNRTSKFDPSKSKTLVRDYKEILLEYQDDKNLIGITATDDIYISNEKIMRGNFILATRSDSFTNTEGMIGLGYSPSTFEEKYSFIDQLYNNGIISHKVFTQSFLSSDRGELTFGKIPNMILENPRYYGRCDAIDRIENGQRYKNKNWQCELSGIFFGKNYSSENVKSFYSNKVSFFSYRKRALVPLVFFDYLQDTYFKDLISNNICSRVHKGKYNIYSCKNDSFEIKEFNLLFGDWGMKFTKNELFKYNNENEAYEFIFYHKKDFEKYSLGRPIVRNFHMVYDKHNEEIGFYSENYVFYIGNNTVFEPPKTHDFKLDKTKKTRKDERINRPIIKPEDILDKSDQEEVYVPTIQSKSVSSAFIIQLFLHIFIGIFAVIFAIFCIFAFIRYRKRNKFPGMEYYKKQSEKLNNAKINNN